MYKVLKVLITPIFSIFLILGIYLTIMTVYLKFSFVYIIFILYFFNWLTTIIIFFGKRRVEVKLSWIFTISFLPIIGMLAYFLYGREYKHKRKNKKYKIYSKSKISYEDTINTNYNLEKLSLLSPNFYDAFKLSNSVTGRGVYSNSNIKILEPEDSWIHIVDDIKKSKVYIFITYFILSKCKSFSLLVELLIKKHNEGVMIYFLYDHVGTYFQNISKEIKKIKKSGIKIYKFEKFLIPFVKGSVSYRNHRKDIIIDGKIGYTGGVNIGDSYLNLGYKLGKINDLHCRITGPAIKSLELIFMNDWFFTTNQELNYLEKNNFQINHYPIKKNNSYTQIIDSGPIKPLSMHKNIILKMINSSKKRIWLSTPYFIPPEDIMNALKIAGKLGKDVRLLIPGKTDKAFILSLSKLYASELIKFNVKIYVMNNVFNHAKFSIFDDEISIISTTNLDNRSFFLDYQTMVLNYDKELNSKFKNKFESYFKLSYLLSSEEINNWNYFYKLIIKFLKFASPIL